MDLAQVTEAMATARAEQDYLQDKLEEVNTRLNMLRRRRRHLLRIQIEAEIGPVDPATQEEGLDVGGGDGGAKAAEPKDEGGHQEGAQQGPAGSGPKEPASAPTKRPPGKADGKAERHKRPRHGEEACVACWAKAHGVGAGTTHLRDGVLCLEPARPPPPEGRPAGATKRGRPAKKAESPVAKASGPAAAASKAMASAVVHGGAPSAPAAEAGEAGATGAETSAASAGAPPRSPGTPKDVASDND
jgi:hypothetical protein